MTIDGKGKTSAAVRVDHHRQQFIDFLHTLPPGSEIPLEATGHWYWVVDEMEKAGHRPHLANPVEAKKRMGKTNKTDALDAKGLAILLHNSTRPRVGFRRASCATGANCSAPGWRCAICVRRLSCLARIDPRHALLHEPA